MRSLVVFLLVFCFFVVFVGAEDFCTYQEPTAAWELTSDGSDCASDHDWTNSGATFNGSGADFESSENDYMSISNANAQFLEVVGTGNFTLCLNATFESVSGGQTLLGNRDYIVDDTGFSISGGNANFSWTSQGTEWTPIVPEPLVHYLLCFRRNGSRMQGFNNNTLIFDNVATGDMDSTSNFDLELGRRSNAGDQYFDGQINSLIFWNKSLTDAQIGVISTKNFDAGSPPTFSNFVNGSPNFRRYENFSGNVSITDVELNFSWFSTNASGLWVNDSVVALNGVTNYDFNNSANISVSNGSSVCWQVFANDSSGTLGSSDLECFVVGDSPPVFNESFGDQSVLTPGGLLALDFNCSDVDGSDVVYSDNVSLFEVDSASGIVNDVPLESDNGSHGVNVTCGNGLGVSQVFGYFVGDGVAPLLSVPENSTPVVYSSSFLSSFNVTLVSNNGGFGNTSVGFNHSGSWVNYSLNNLTGNKFNYNLSLGAGSFSYYFWANDSFGNLNVSGVYNFTVERNRSLVVIVFNESRVNYSESVNVTGKLVVGDSFNISIVRNGSLLGNGSSELQLTENFTVPVVYEYCVNYSDSENFSANGSCGFVTVVDEVLPGFSSFVNGSPNFRFGENFSANVTVSDGFLNFSWFGTNSSGSWVNSSFTALNGVTTYRFNTSSLIDVTSGNVVCYEFFVNDSSGNVNGSGLFCFSVVVTPSVSVESEGGVSSGDDYFCGDGVCWVDEDFDSCPLDCVQLMFVVLDDFWFVSESSTVVVSFLDNLTPEFLNFSFSPVVNISFVGSSNGSYHFFVGGEVESGEYFLEVLSDLGSGVFSFFVASEDDKLLRLRAAKFFSSMEGFGRLVIFILVGVVLLGIFIVLFLRDKKVNKRKKFGKGVEEEIFGG